jgi:predicted aspartyl protease
MKLHALAVGTLQAAKTRTRLEVWTYADGPQTGTQTFAASGNDFREDTTLGPLHTARGQLAGKRWEQNASGLTRWLSAIHQRDDANDYALAHPLLPASDVRLLGQVDSPLHAYVVKVAPKNGRVEYAFFDAKTYLLVRDERAAWGRRLVRTYDDFRITSGLRMPWHIHESNGLPRDDRDWQLRSLAVGEPLDRSALAIPPSHDPVSLNGTRVTLPATISGDRIVLTARIGAHKVNFLMDSGSSGVLLNRDVADATGVQSFGQKTEVTAGQYLASDALIPQIDFGVAHMENVAAETAPYAEETYGEVPIAGLLGYDFIAGAVIHVDYVHGAVEAVAPDSFSPPAGAIALPIRLDDGVPVIDARIGSAVGKNFIVDTGADRSMLFSSFAQAHPADVADQGLGDEMTASFPFTTHINGVGGKVQVRPVQVSSLALGSLNLPNWLFYVSQDAASFEGDDYDGLIGQDVLRNFDLYFDYARAMMYLVPNDRYRQRWGA